MKRKVDELGRIVIPVEMRKELDIGCDDYLEIELKDGKIVLSQPDKTNYKGIIFEAVEFLSRCIKNEDYYDEVSYSELCELYKILLKGVNDEVDN